MKAFLLEKAGGVENLQLTEIEKPAITKDEVLLKVAAISINPVDVKARVNEKTLDWLFGSGRPIILGWDIAGEVIETGDAVTSFKTGDQVFGMIHFPGNGKGYATYVAAPATHLALKPENIPYEEAVATTLAASTAYQALINLAQIKKGNKVLIHGAAGGVGHLAVQIAKHFGGYVIGTSSAKNKDFVLSLGADEHIDYTKENFAQKLRNIDIVLDTVQGNTLLHSVDVVDPNGIIITLPSQAIPQEIKDKAREKNVRLEFMMVASQTETINAIAGLLKNGFLKPHIHKIFSFEEMAKAHLEVETGHVAGKVVVTV